MLFPLHHHKISVFYFRSDNSTFTPIIIYPYLDILFNYIRYKKNKDSFIKLTETPYNSRFGPCGLL